MTGLGDRQSLLLRILSDNSRSTITSITKKLGCSRITTSRLLSKLENELGIRYTLEINQDKLEPSELHVIHVKFGKNPNVKSLQSFFKDDFDSEAVYLSKNNKNMVVLSRTKDPPSYLQWEQRMANAISRYNPTIKHSEIVHSNFGFFPLNDNFVEQIRRDLKITQKDKQILSIMNQNSRINYNDLSRKTGLNEDTIHYRVYRLQKMGLIKRFTIAVQNPPYKYANAYLVDYSFAKNPNKYIEFAGKLHSDWNYNESALNPFQVVTLTRGSYRLFLIGLFKDRIDSVERFVSKHRKAFKDEGHVEVAEMIKPIKGILPFRSIS